MVRAKNYEIVSTFVKVIQKKLWPLFFPDTVYKYRLENIRFSAGYYLKANMAMSVCRCRLSVTVSTTSMIAG